MKPTTIIAIVLTALFATSVPTRASTVTLTATLTGPGESPPNTSTGTGKAGVIYDSTAHSLTVNVSFSGLTGTTTASHIHCCVSPPAATGVATAVPTFPGFPLGVTSGTYSNTFDLTLLSSFNPAFVAANGGTAASAEAALASGFANGTSYLNIHTNVFPGGEIRGFLQVVPPLYDPSEAGSVLVFPKFVRGTVAPGVPATEIEISAHCPVDLQPCAVPGTSVRLFGQWVCPGQLETQICRQNNFIFSTTIEGTVSLNTEGGAVGVNFATVKVPAPPCPEGYLIVYAVDTRNRPIKFDGLVGDAVIRWNSRAAGSYNAVAIQANPALLEGALITLGPGGGLIFDAGPGHYQAITGTVMGTVKYDTLTPAADAPVTTTLTLLTLDTLSNRPNNQVFTDIDFYDSNENVISEFLSYTCWTETALSSIDPSLTRDFLTRKGFFVSLDATKVPQEGITDTVGPVTQIGLIDTQECPGSAACSENVPVTSSNNPTVVNHYAYRADDDSIPVPTTFTGP